MTHTISFKIDDDTKKKIENFIETEGLQDIDDFILKAIEDELFLHENVLSTREQDGSTKIDSEEESLRRTLVELTERLRALPSHEEKIKLLATFDDLFQNNLKIIKEKYSFLVNGILRSL